MPVFKGFEESDDGRKLAVLHYANAKRGNLYMHGGDGEPTRLVNVQRPIPHDERFDEAGLLAKHRLTFEDLSNLQPDSSLDDLIRSRYQKSTQEFSGFTPSFQPR